MSGEVDSRITPALHPENVRQIEGFNDSEVKPFLGAVETAFSEAYEGLRAIHDAKEAGARNPAMNDAAKLLQVDDFAHKRLGKIAKGFDSVSASLDKTIASIEADLSKPVESKAAASVAAEVRAHIKGLGSEERMKVIREAIEGGDHAVATAVLGAPAMLSGIAPQMQAAFLKQYHSLHNPVQAKRLKALQAAKGLLDRNAPLALAETDRAVGYLTDPKTSRKIYPAELRKQRDAAQAPFAS
jgi:hypothetical protein